MENTPPRPKQRSLRHKILAGLSVVGLTLMVLIGWRWTVTMQAPVLTIPNPVMPNPNAYDYYVGAATGIVNSKQIDEVSATIPTYQPAVHAPGGTGEGENLEAVYPPPTMPMTFQSKAMVVQQNAAVIAQLHQGFEHPYLQPACRSFDAYFYGAEFRKLARLLELQGRVRAEKSDWPGATDSYLDILRMGEDIPHGATVMGSVAGTNCQFIGSRSLWKTIEHLDAAQSHVALRRLTRILEQHLPFAENLQEEKWYGQNLRLELFRDTRRFSSRYVPIGSADDPANEMRLTLFNSIYLVYSKNRIMHDFTAYMDAASAQARQPYALHAPEPPEPKDPINRFFLSDWRQARWNDVHCETLNELLLVTLALHTYRLERGHYPASLKELAPVYLQRLPDDPCATEGTFHYRLQGDNYILYSVGPDGKDDGGRPVDNPKDAGSTNPLSRYRVGSESLGDIVAGINILKR